MSNCPICLSIDGYELRRQPTHHDRGIYLECAVCGMFGVHKFAVDDFLDPKSPAATLRIRATLSHWLRQNPSKTQNTTFLSAQTVEDAMEGRLTLPSPAQVALEIIRYIGDYVHRTGTMIEDLPPEFPAVIGSPSRRAAVNLVKQLTARNLVQSTDYVVDGFYDARDLDLTLAGWEAYEAERKGKKSGGYGFLAMKFGDEKLEALAQKHLKPAIKELGYDLVDLRDVAAPGIIDNIMRIRIRDADFVIVDLSHDNFGAYWEAGYAEGLGKPVLYICEKEKFSESGTHFDTNHCTTVMWTTQDPELFCKELVATLRRALPA